MKTNYAVVAQNQNDTLHTVYGPFECLEKAQTLQKKLRDEDRAYQKANPNTKQMRRYFSVVLMEFQKAE